RSGQTIQRTRQSLGHSGLSHRASLWGVTSGKAKKTAIRTERGASGESPFGHLGSLAERSRRSAAPHGLGEERRRIRFRDRPTLTGERTLVCRLTSDALVAILRHHLLSVDLGSRCDRFCA